MRKFLAATAVALLLVGCAPSTETAYKKCYAARSAGVKENESLTFDQKVDKLAAAGVTCLDESKADPAAFNEKWGE